MAGLAAAAGLAVAACSQGASNPVRSGDVSPPAGTSAPSASPGGAAATSGSSPAPTAPLTGLPATSASAAARPAVALVLAGPNPQGLTSADVVFEQIASPVRYIAAYQSRLVTSAGPITTTQPTDRGVLAVLHPLIGYDGAAAGYFVKLLDKTKLKDVSYARYPSGYTLTPHGLTASVQAILHAASGDTAPPPLFRYQGAASGASKLAVSDMWRPTSARVVLPGGGIQEWSYSSRANRWLLASGGPKVQVTNLVVQTVPYRQIGVNRHHGIVVPTAQVTGSGRVEVFSAGTAASGTWSKPHVRDVTNYFDSSGSPMAFQPGPTWVVLAPPGTQVSTSS
jgi:hypothetical protein